MSVRRPVAASLVPLGLGLGVLLVGVPHRAPNDVRVEAPATTDGSSTTVASVPPTGTPSTTAAPPTIPTTSTAGTVSFADEDPPPSARSLAVVVLADAAGEGGSADLAAAATALRQAGFTNVLTTVAIEAGPSAVYHRESLEDAAALVARVLGLPASAVDDYPVDGDPFTLLDDNGDLVVLLAGDAA